MSRLPHVHHDLIVEWAKDTSRVVECLSDCGNWYPIENPSWGTRTLYRIKRAEPKFIVVNGVNVPEPVREPLKDEQTYWVADPTLSHIKLSGLWTSTITEMYWLSLGLIHLTREAAQAHIDAMLLPSRTDK